MTAFVLYRAKGEIYDYDFARKNRDHKLERERFSYGEFPVEKAGSLSPTGVSDAENAKRYVPLMPFKKSVRNTALTAIAVMNVVIAT